MDKSSSEMKDKQAYEKPRLRVIELVAEEVMGIGCKTVSGPGSGSVCAAVGCFEIGS
ncbi:MAG: hypothetical protein HZB31_09635 [Nitrospirae bacterium]|nr:hypothetical protein [Nitrospirota bacterium]